MVIIEYKWLVGQRGDDLVLTNWEGEQDELAAYDENIMTPDVDEDGMPVVRVIGDGRLALHVRIERDEPLRTTRKGWQKIAAIMLGKWNEPKYEYSDR